MNREQTAAWVRAAQAGDDVAFAELVRAHQDIAVAYATAILSDFHLAEDAAQEAFVEAYRALPALRDPAAFTSWFRTIVRKHCDRAIRRKRVPTTGLDAALVVASPEPSAHERLERQDAAASVQSSVATLPDAEREVVLLYYMGDHSQAAIAKFLDITANAVKTRLYAARQRLRDQMADIEDNLNAARPSASPAFVDKVQRMIRPEALTKTDRLVWSTGMGTDVWEMFCAAITGDLDTIKRLLAKDPSLVRGAYNYRRPMYFAVRENQLAVARYLLEHGADPSNAWGPDSLLDIARDRGYDEMLALLEAAVAAPSGVTADGHEIASAIRERDVGKVRRLLDANPELVHAIDAAIHSNQPIHWAAMTRQLDVIDELLARGADINAKRSDGARPIQLCNGDYMYRGWRDVPDTVTTTPRQVLDHLRARGAYCDICTASYIGDVARVQELLAEDSSLANRPSDYVTYYACSGTPLRNAAAAGHIEIVKLLLAAGADPNLPEEEIAPRGHALHSAVCNGHIEIVKLLLDQGAYPNVEIESSADTLSAAIARDDKPMIELLCSYGAARNVGLLAHYGDIQTAAAVFAANPKLADDPGALGSAGDKMPFVRLMLRYQPELPKRVSFAGSREVTELLFAHGMDPNKPDWMRVTPLHRFAERGDFANATLFIEHGAEVNARDEELSSTPLGWAAKYGKTRMVELLLRHGAKPNLPDDPPWATPLAWATRRGHHDIVRILTQFAETGAAPADSIARYEALAQDLVAAHITGEPAALQRVADHFAGGRRIDRDDVRRFVKAKYGRPDSGADLSLDDAQYIVARTHGFDGWNDLRTQIATE